MERARIPSRRARIATMSGRRPIARLAGAALLVAAAPALADKIKHPTAVFAGLDKITGRIIAFEVGDRRDGAVRIAADHAARLLLAPAYRTPQTDLRRGRRNREQNKTFKRIFTGWMFADSPGMHGVEHPVYDIWLTHSAAFGVAEYMERQLATRW